MGRIKILLIVVSLTGWTSIHGQSNTSLYSSQGIGELTSTGLQQNFAMGGLGYAIPHAFHINVQNPSMLNYNRFSTFAVGLMGDFRHFTSEGIDTRKNIASLRYLAMSFPLITSKWTTAITLLPYSSVKYDTYSIDELSGSNGSLTQYQGNGGLSTLSWSHGFRLFNSFSIGVKGSFVFGAITEVSRIQLSGEDVSEAYVVAYEENSSYKDLQLSLSFSNKFKLSDRNFLNVGGVYNLSGDLNGEKEGKYERYLSSGSLLQSRVLSTEDIQYSLPSIYGIGISFERFNKLTIGTDFEFQTWENGAGSGVDQSLKNTVSFILGGEITPDIQSVSSYLARSTYRIGAQFKTLPYMVNNTQINDFGINFGISLPVSGLSSIDAAFKYGLRGTTENNLIQESYFQAVIGATINDRWFIKRKYD